MERAATLVSTVAHLLSNQAVRGAMLAFRCAVQPRRRAPQGFAVLALRIARGSAYATRGEAKADIFDYISAFTIKFGGIAGFVIKVRSTSQLLLMPIQKIRQNVLAYNLPFHGVRKSEPFQFSNPEIKRVN